MAQERMSPRMAIDVAWAGCRQRLRLAQRALSGGPVMTIGPAWRHPTAFAVAGALVLLPTFVFVGASLFAYELGFSGLRGAIESVSAVLARWRVVDLLLVAAPGIALLAALAPLVRFGTERRDGGLEAVVAVRARPLNIVIGLLALALASLLVWHIVVESVLQAGA
jgi:hypothetical protein